MSVFKAEPVVVPDDLAERFDSESGHEKGYLRNLIADKGKLHQLDEELLAIGLMSFVKGLMSDKNIPDSTKPLSVERLSNVVYVLMFAYCIGTMRVEEDGDVTVGRGFDDLRKALDVQLSKKIKFANGKAMPVPEFMVTLKIASSPESIGDAYNKIVTRHGLTKEITPQAAFDVAKTSIIGAKDVMERGK